MKLDDKIILFGVLLMLKACHNVEKEYYGSGQLKSKSRIKEGVKTGKEECFSEDGYLSAIYNYDNGKKNGPFEMYYETGKLYKNGFYHNDKLEGTFVEFSDRGDTLFQKIFKEGDIKVNIRYRLGKPSCKMDLSMGLMTFFDEKGKVQKIIEINE